LKIFFSKRAINKKHTENNINVRVLEQMDRKPQKIKNSKPHLISDHINIIKVRSTKNVKDLPRPGTTVSNKK